MADCLFWTIAGAAVAVAVLAFFGGLYLVREARKDW